MTPLWLAFVLSIADGDTFRARGHLWTDLFIETSIRIADIDTPEAGGRAKCEQERRLAQQATTALTELIKGRSLYLSHVEPDKYGGRYLARVLTAEGTNVGDALISRGLAVSYTGRGPRKDWCQ